MTLLLGFVPHHFCLLAKDLSPVRGKDVSPVRGQEVHREEVAGGSSPLPSEQFLWATGNGLSIRCNIGNVVQSAQARIFRHTAGMDAFSSILLQLQNELFSLHMVQVVQKCALCLHIPIPHMHPWSSYVLLNTGEQSDHSRGFMLLLFFPLVFHS